MNEKPVMTGVIEWRPVVGFPGYMVSDRGTVMSYRRHPAGQLLRCTLNQAGYLQVGLHPGSFIEKVAPLVLTTFVGPRPAPGHHARHLNGNKLDNRLANLAWGTPKQNLADAIRHGTLLRGHDINTSKLTAAQVLEIYNSPLSNRRAAKLYGVRHSSVAGIRLGRTWVHITGGPRAWTYDPHTNSSHPNVDPA